MKAYYKNYLGHTFLYKGYEYIAYNTGRQSGKWYVHFYTRPDLGNAVPEQRTKTAACNLAEKIIDKFL